MCQGKGSSEPVEGGRSDLFMIPFLLDGAPSPLSLNSSITHFVPPSPTQPGILDLDDPDDPDDPSKATPTGRYKYPPVKVTREEL
jgi:hypothetical protein